MRQIGGGDQAVVAAADDHGVVACPEFHWLIRRLKSLTASLSFYHRATEAGSAAVLPERSELSVPVAM
jgi:hypothetical protein